METRAVLYTPENIKTRLDEHSRYWPSGCRLWNNHLTKGGYGMTSFDGKDYYVHRLAWELANGPIPAGMFILHRCDVRHCLAVEHLFLGTAKDNTDDAMRKGRLDLHGLTNLGEKHPNCKITADIVRHIRKTMAGAPRGTQRKLAAELGITEANVSLIVKRKAWSHIE